MQVGTVRRVRVETLHAADTGVLLGYLDCHVWRMVSRRYPGQRRSYNEGTWVTPEQAEQFARETAESREAYRVEHLWTTRLKRWINKWITR